MTKKSKIDNTDDYFKKLHSGRGREIAISSWSDNLLDCQWHVLGCTNRCRPRLQILSWHVTTWQCDLPYNVSDLVIRRASPNSRRPTRRCRFGLLMAFRRQPTLCHLPHLLIYQAFNHCANGGSILSAQRCILSWLCTPWTTGALGLAERCNVAMDPFALGFVWGPWQALTLWTSDYLWRCQGAPSRFGPSVSSRCCMWRGHGLSTIRKEWPRGTRRPPCNRMVTFWTFLEQY